jgi:hypothetical protein
MHDPLILLVPPIFAAIRSLTIAVWPPANSAASSTISAEMEYQFLLVTALSLVGLLATLFVMIQFPDVGEAIAELNQS